MGMIECSVADALFSGLQQRLLAVLFGQPDRSFYGNELLRLTGTGRGALQRELEKLVSADLVTVTPVGNQKHYQANAAAPIFAELRGIVMKTLGLADVLRTALNAVADRIELAFVFGSVAKGTDTHRSDIDLVVVGNAELLALSEALYSTEQALGRAIHLSLYEPAEWRELRANDPVMRQIDQGPKLQLLPDAQTA